MAIKQISIFVENKEGKLVTITDSIANVGTIIQDVLSLCNKSHAIQI